MTMTPESVRNKQFETVRLREGYDMGEVDLFLDQVEHELERLNNENASLRARIETLQTDRPESAPADKVPAKAVEPPVPAAQAPSPAPTAAPAPAAAPTVQSVSQASTAAVRILEKAAISADELVNEAREQADKLTGDARVEAENLQAAAKASAERVTNEAHGKASRLDADSRTRADNLNREVSARRVELFGKLETERDKLARDVEELRTFERDYRSRLKGYFSDQLKALDTTPSHADDVASGDDSRSDGDDTPHLRALGDERS